MKYKDFRNYSIERTYKIKHNNPSDYKPALKKDFKSRCAYCNILDDHISCPFEVDHYIPRNSFNPKDPTKIPYNPRPELNTKYENLIYSCPKCNNAKRSLFKGDLEDPLNNEEVYDPTVVNYNDIFFRTFTGAIGSNNKIGITMIQNIKLYRPIHNLAWLAEQVKELVDKINYNLKFITNKEKIQKMRDLKLELMEYKDDITSNLIANYNPKR